MAIMGRPPKKIELERQVIGDHPHVIIGPPDHRLASRSRIPLRWLVNDTFLLRESGSDTRILTDQMFAKADLAPSFGMEFGSNETIKQAVMAGLGVAFISAHTVAAEVAQGRMIVLQVTGLPVVRKWYLLRAKAKHLLPAGTALWKFLVKHGERFPPDVSALVGRSKSRARSRKR